MKKILITGAAGFIGFHLVLKLLKETDWQIVGLDNINDYYDVNLKYARLEETGIGKEKTDNAEHAFIQSNSYSNYNFTKLDITDKDNLLKLFETERFDYVVNLAAQAGVRYSLENPQAYIDSNINGFFNILEACRLNPVKHLIYASSSSVYGNNKKTPFSEGDRVDHPISLYAATKKSNELMAYTYSHLYKLPTTGLRFFTVYGPWGRPDMAYFLYTKAILEDKPIKLFNNGNMLRDFTYIDDIVEGIFRLLLQQSEPNYALNLVKQELQNKIYNIGNSKSEQLLKFIKILEDALGKKAKKVMMPMQSGDVHTTWADTTEIEKQFAYRPSTNIENGINKFVDWYRLYFKENLGV